MADLTEYISDYLRGTNDRGLGAAPSDTAQSGGYLDDFVTLMKPTDDAGLRFGQGFLPGFQKGLLATGMTQELAQRCAERLDEPLSRVKWQTGMFLGMLVGFIKALLSSLAAIGVLVVGLITLPVWGSVAAFMFWYKILSDPRQIFVSAVDGATHLAVLTRDTIIGFVDFLLVMKRKPGAIELEGEKFGIEVGRITGTMYVQSVGPDANLFWTGWAIGEVVGMIVFELVALLIPIEALMVKGGVYFGRAGGYLARSAALSLQDTALARRVWGLMDEVPALVKARNLEIPETAAAPRPRIEMPATAPVLDEAPAALAAAPARRSAPSVAEASATPRPPGAWAEAAPPTRGPQARPLSEGSGAPGPAAALDEARGTAPVDRGLGGTVVTLGGRDFPVPSLAVARRLEYWYGIISSLTPNKGVYVFISESGEAYVGMAAGEQGLRQRLLGAFHDQHDKAFKRMWDSGTDLEIYQLKRRIPGFSDEQLVQFMEEYMMRTSRAMGDLEYTNSVAGVQRSFDAVSMGPKSPPGRTPEQIFEFLTGGPPFQFFTVP